MTLGLSWVMQAVATEGFLERPLAVLQAAGQQSLDLLIAVGIGLLGWAVAATIATVVRTLLRWLRFNEGVRGLVGGRMLGVHEPSDVVAWALYWILIAVGLVIAFDVLGFDLSTSLAARMRDILPRVLTAAILLVGGVLAATLLGAVTRRFFESAGIPRARIRGQAVTVLFSFVAVLLALEQLGFAAQFVMGMGLVLAGAVGLTAALAFGLGCRDLARDFVVEYIKSLEDRPSGS